MEEEEILDRASAWDAGKASEKPQKEKVKKPKLLPKWPLLLIKPSDAFRFRVFLR